MNQGLKVGNEGQRQWKQEEDEKVNDDEDGIGRRKGYEGLGGSDGHPIRLENEGYLSFHSPPLYLQTVAPPFPPPWLWQHLNSGSHQSYLPGINQNLLPLSVR